MCIQFEMRVRKTIDKVQCIPVKIDVRYTFREKSDKAPRINFRGFKFRGCNPVYKCAALHH